MLCDPCKYADWVIGARRIRDADARWPQVGARFHHALGAGPIELKDSTVVTECDPPTRLVLRAAFRPAGEACVDLTIEGGATSTLIILREWPIAGPVRRWRGWMLDMATHARNTFALRRLRRLAEQSDPAQEDTR